MPAINQDVTHWAGDTLTITIGPVVDQDGALVDLSGASANWWMGKSATATGADVYIKKATGQTQLDDDGVTTENQIDIVRTETDQWSLVIRIVKADTETGPKPNTYYHEAEVTDADGKDITVTVGKYVLKPTIIKGV